MDRSSFNIRESQATAKSRYVRGTNKILNVKSILPNMFAVTSKDYLSNRRFAREQKISLLYDRVAVVL